MGMGSYWIEVATVAYYSSDCVALLKMGAVCAPTQYYNTNFYKQIPHYSLL